MEQIPLFEFDAMVMERQHKPSHLIVAAMLWTSVILLMTEGQEIPLLTQAALLLLLLVFLVLNLLKGFGE